MDKRPEDIKITLRVPPEVAAMMKQLAREHARSLNGELVWAIQRNISPFSRNRRVTVESVRKLFKYQPHPTPEQERALKHDLWCCRERYNAGLEERKLAWESATLP